MSRKPLVIAISVSALVLTGCYEQESRAQSVQAVAEPAIDQSETCFFRDLGLNRNCKIGQKAIMLPDEEYAREELSLMFVARYCDFRYPIVANGRGVTCIFYPEKSALKSEAEIERAAQEAAEAAAAATRESSK